jgi:type II secretory pathway pseudopilin PulG
MIISSKTSKGAARRSRRWAFTLVELLLVMFIMSVVASLVVGVSWYVIEQGRKAETVVKQKRLIEAIKAYTKVVGKAPDLGKNPITKVPYEDIAILHRKLLLGPTADANSGTENFDRNNIYYKATSPFLGNDDGGSLLADAYGKAMIYQKDKGFGGAPRIVSAGPDGYFGLSTDEPGVVDALKCQRDNIYSDN